MDTFISSPSKLNRKLFCYVNPIIQKSQGYYSNISKNITSSCRDLESKLRNLCIRVSPSRSTKLSRLSCNYPQESMSPLHSSFASTHSNIIPKMNHARHCINSSIVTRNKSLDIKRALSDKDNIIKEFCNLSELAMEKMNRLSTLNESIASKLNEYERKSKRVNDAKLNQTSNNHSKIDSIWNSTLYNSRGNINSKVYEPRRHIDSFNSINSRNYNNSRGYYSYHRPLAYEIKSTAPRRQCNFNSNLENRDCYYNESQCEIKLNELKSKIIDLEKVFEFVQKSQRHNSKNKHQPSNYQNQYQKYTYYTQY